MRSAIIGAGTAGVRAAVELDNRNSSVLLIEKNFYVGGKLTELSRLYPVCELYYAHRFFSQLNDSVNVDIMTGSDVVNIEKSEGNTYTLTIRKTPRYVTGNCTLCLECVDVCTHQAVHKPPFQSIPQTVYIDRETCGACRKCEKICPESAITLDEKEELVKREVEDVIFCTGSELVDPEKYSEFGYGRFPDVITSMELEKMLHPSFESKFVRLSDGKRPERIAFLQCVGSRDAVRGEPYCSRVCCMQALNEARVIKERYPDTEPYIFFTDLQCSGKRWEHFCETARGMGVTCIRCRIPAVYEEQGSVSITYAEDELVTMTVDMIVLSTGIVPPANKYGLPENEYGFPREKSCGLFFHPADITESVQEALAALSSVPGSYSSGSAWTREPGLDIVLCRCGTESHLADMMRNRGYRVRELDDVCRTAQHSLLKQEKTVVGACALHEQLFLRLAQERNSFVEVVPLREMSWISEDGDSRERSLQMAVAKLERLDTSRITWSQTEVFPAVVIVGGGVAGLAAALDLADTYKVVIIEKSPHLGGRALNIQYSLGYSPREVAQDLIQRAEIHSNIEILTGTEITTLTGDPGNFTVGTTRQDITCGAIIVAAGADEFQHQYDHPLVITQTQLEDRIRNNDIPHVVVMVQCMGSRNQEHHWCSAVCCSKAISNSLTILEKTNAQVLILYRDMRTYGFQDSYYRKAREKGVIFLQNDEMPEIRVGESVSVVYEDPILHARILIEPDLLVLSTGTIPKKESRELAKILGISLDQDGFFRESHPEFYPTDSTKDGIFICGLCHSPQNVKESVIQARAAASRARTFLSSAYKTCTAITVKQELCTGCSICVDVCPFKAISLESDELTVDMSLCKDCGLCVGSCPTSALTQTTLSDDQIRGMVRVMEGIE